jgi:hypothetical protein
MRFQKEVVPKLKFQNNPILKGLGYGQLVQYVPIKLKDGIA